MRLVIKSVIVSMLAIVINSGIYEFIGYVDEYKPDSIISKILLGIASVALAVSILSIIDIMKGNNDEEDI